MARPPVLQASVAHIGARREEADAERRTAWRQAGDAWSRLREVWSEATPEARLRFRRRVAEAMSPNPAVAPADGRALYACLRRLRAGEPEETRRSSARPGSTWRRVRP